MKIIQPVKIIVSQKDKKLLVKFFYSDARHWRDRSPDLCVGVDKADDFINVLDKFLKKRKMKIESLQKVGLEFVNVGVLTERVIRAIMKGLYF